MKNVIIHAQNHLHYFLKRLNHSWMPSQFWRPPKKASDVSDSALKLVQQGAYEPADATAIPKHYHLLPHLNPDWFYLSVTGLPRLSWKEAVKRV